MSYGTGMGKPVTRSRGRGSGFVGVGECMTLGSIPVLALCLLLCVVGAEATQPTSFSKHSYIQTTTSGGLTSSGGAVYNIRNLGARGDGHSDDTQAFLKAWSTACNHNGPSTVLVPSGGSFVLASNTKFIGLSCPSHITFQVDGVILGPSHWTKAKSASASWMQFQDCKNFVLTGKGTFDARGESFWPAKKGGPTAIRFLRATNVVVKGITIKNSPQVNLKFNYANGVTIQGITIDCPGTSPNTDGIHLQTNVVNVQILDCIIKSGDDCISIGTGVHEVIINNIICGPGHGISIGSLGTKGLLACVSDIDISDVTFINTLAACRIKTCAGGLGKATRISYRNINVQNVQMPIMVEQFYCGSSGKKKNVILDTITFVNVKGSCAPSETAPVHLNCAGYGCSNVRLQDIELTDHNNKPVWSFCSKSYGTYGGVMQPPGCLQYRVGANSESVPGCAA